MTTDDRITQEELKALFGPLVPMDAMAIIMEKGQTPAGARERLRKLAAKTAVNDTLLGLPSIAAAGLREVADEILEDGVLSVDEVKAVASMLHDAANYIDLLRKMLPVRAATVPSDTIALADRIERGLLYLTGDGPLLESEHCLIVAALRANRAAAVPSDTTTTALSGEAHKNLVVLLEDDANEVIVRYRTGDRTKKEIELTGAEVEAIVAALDGCSPDSGEIDRLRERCLAYKGQVEAGSIAIQHLQGEIARMRDALEQAVSDFGDSHCVCEDTKQMCIAALLPSGQPQEPRG